MKAFFLAGLIFLIGSTVWAQNKFKLKHSSKDFDIRLSVAECSHLNCHGPATFIFYKKGHKKPFQVIKVSDSYMDLFDREDLSTGQIELAEQTAIIVGDFNFDGSPDVAINGSNRPHQSWSYQIYLFSKRLGKFVFNPTVSQMGKHLALAQLDERRKVLRVFGRDEKGHYQVNEYTVINNRPVKVLIETREMLENQTRVKITIKRLVNGKWKTKVEIVRPEDLK